MLVLKKGNLNSSHEHHVLLPCHLCVNHQVGEKHSGKPGSQLRSRCGVSFVKGLKSFQKLCRQASESWVEENQKNLKQLRTVLFLTVSTSLKYNLTMASI